MRNAASHGDLRIGVEDGTDRTLRLVARRGEAEVWSVELPVTDGDRSLMPRATRPRVVAGHVFVGTDGEHYRGASAHQIKLHCVDLGGSLRWTKDWDAEGLFVERAGAVLFMVRRVRYHPKVGVPPFDVLRVRPETGAVLDRWPVPWPEHVTKSGYLSGGLVVDGAQLFANVSGRRALRVPA